MTTDVVTLDELGLLEEVLALAWATPGTVDLVDLDRVLDRVVTLAA